MIDVSPTLAQSGPAPRSSGGVFGATRSDAADRHRFNVTFALSEAFDSEVPQELASQARPESPQSGGYSTMANASAEYALVGRRTHVAGSAQTAFQYYGSLRTVNPVSHSAALGGSLRLPARGTIQVNQSAAYSPSYLFQLFPSVSPPEPGDTIPVAADYRADFRESYTYRSDVTVGFGSARGTQVGASGEYGRTDFQQPSAQRDLSVAAARTKLSQGFARNGQLGVEYEYRKGEFGVSGVTTEHRLAVGVEYSPALSTSRRASLRFRVAPSTLVIPESATDAPAERLYRMEGEASLTYPFRRSWQASGTYRRGVEYVAVLAEPVYADTARVEVFGLVSRRVDLLATAGYADGESALNRGSQLNALTGDIMVRYGWTRSIALFGQYVYYHYDFRGQHLIAPDLPSLFEQHGVRIGVMLWASPF